MNYLLDTHICLWYFENSERLSTKARELFKDSANIYYSPITVLEIAIKNNFKPASLKCNAKQFCEFAHKSNLMPLPLKEAHISNLTFMKRNRDPFDNALLAQARAENLLLVTHDKAIIDEEDKNVLAV